jgi:hypothetical protein
MCGPEGAVPCVSLRMLLPARAQQRFRGLSL